MANNDQIYAAYEGKMGEDFQRQTQQRIDWILKQIKNQQNVLDIGCSQGIVSILCAEQCSTVTGIDIQEENIMFARQLVNDKFSHVKDKISFIHSDFMKYKAQDKYDAIIITEVIEHLNNGEEFLNHATDFLQDDGVVVITTPFGYCDHPDHVYTFFLSTFWKLIETAFAVENIYYGGNWMGCVARKKGNSCPCFILNQNAFEDEEIQFLNLQKIMQEKINNLYTNLQEANQKYRASCENYETLKSWRENELHTISDLKEQLQCAFDEKEKLENITNSYNGDISTYKNMITELIQTGDEYAQTALRAKRIIQKQQRELQMLREENEIYKQRWNKLSSKWYGRFALKCYYKLRIWNILK